MYIDLRYTCVKKKYVQIYLQYIYYHMRIFPNQLWSSKNSYSSMKQNTTFSQSASGHAKSPFFATIEYPHTISNFHIHLL